MIYKGKVLIVWHAGICAFPFYIRLGTESAMQPPFDSSTPIYLSVCESFLPPSPLNYTD